MVETRIAKGLLKATPPRDPVLAASRPQADALAEAGAKLGVTRFRRGDIEHLRLGDSGQTQ